ncbi:molybdenum cofactor guanylyltransferase [Brevibacterium sp.]|uniref:molybdenum cofactor guanylyltransferase n=1 Tax=Brevibacterium sp. TaxID=1701 RepID=UPI0028117B0D|nr:molybdenum cofactor guanylyltransferase [Brevibacterium sp.]
MVTRAIILSGGRSTRFGEVHKPAVHLGDRTVISRVLSTVLSAAPEAEVWVAGPTEGLDEAENECVRAIREEPRFGGPLAGISAAVAQFAAAESAGAEFHSATESARGDGVESDVTFVLAGDMPVVTPGHLQALARACRDTGRPAAAEDDRGKLQFLCAAWPTRLLRSRLSEIGPPVNLPVKRLFETVEPVVIDADPSELADFDTPEEFENLVERTEGL